MAGVQGFPEGFVWGASTAAYQIEGAATADGRGPSVWDTFTSQPGRIADGSTGDHACDHYHRYPEDVALMADLGIGAYRFSLSWSRIQPDGSGLANPAGLAFYDRLTDELLSRGIQPVVNLYHWDLPQALEDTGGWLNRDTAARFADYARIASQALGDRVALWSTLNEPFEHMALGHALGVHAPGRTLALEALPAGHHQLLAHGLAVQVLSETSPAPVMLINSYSPARPASDDEADIFAAGMYDLLQNRLLTDPVLLGSYPAELGELPFVADGDLATIAQPLDYLGVNYYQPHTVRATSDGPLPFDIASPPGYPQTAFGWSVVPDGLRETLTALRDRYGDALPPLYVTENGCAYNDTVDAAGECADPARVTYLDGHINAVRDAIADGVDVRGYFVWSLLDNFEWAEGYTKRFGLVHVDYDTQRRTPKSSYSWYRDLITGKS
ncbi:GH1 family beta-glucosidase [Longispora albida]|uniref:GH1 family beta-glucosidase n=1 Tax=Longispora albida TaxID=203523 RepID=UPI0003751E4C|nr:GH1 family beta-glucosidase [Longispora albida]